MKVYLVGGAVRDSLLHHPFVEKDWVVVGSTPEELLRQGYRQVGKDFPVFLHPDTAEEYALARTERKSGHGYTGFTCRADPGVTLEEDLMRRDLTINAIARDDQGELIDPYGGLADIDARVLRHVSPAFIEDPLRVLRVARFLARYTHLGFSVAPQTLELMREIVNQGELQHLPCERVWTELDKLLGEGNPVAGLKLLEDCGALGALLEEVIIERDATGLARAVSAGANNNQRFAAWLGLLPLSGLDKLCTRLRPPGEYRDLARLTAQYAPELTGEPSAPKFLTFLDGADAWRRPERAQLLLQTLPLVNPALAPTCALLKDAWQAAAGVNAGQYVATGLKGPEIGRALSQGRLEALDSLLQTRRQSIED